MPKKELAEALLPLLPLTVNPRVEVEAVALTHIMAEKTWRIGTEVVDGCVTGAQGSECAHIDLYIRVEGEILLLADDDITTGHLDLVE
jgi:hypothetical protein